MQINAPIQLCLRVLVLFVVSTINLRTCFLSLRFVLVMRRHSISLANTKDKGNFKGPLSFSTLSSHHFNLPDYNPPDSRTSQPPPSIRGSWRSFHSCTQSSCSRRSSTYRRLDTCRRATDRTPCRSHGPCLDSSHPLCRPGPLLV